MDRLQLRSNLTFIGLARQIRIGLQTEIDNASFDDRPQIEAHPQICGERCGQRITQPQGEPGSEDCGGEFACPARFARPHWQGCRECRSGCSAAKSGIEAREICCSQRSVATWPCEEKTALTTL